MTLSVLHILYINQIDSVMFHRLNVDKYKQLNNNNNSYKKEKVNKSVFIPFLSLTFLTIRIKLKGKRSEFKSSLDDCCVLRRLFR